MVKLDRNQVETNLKLMSDSTRHGQQKPWKRIKMIPALEEATGEKFPPSDQLHTTGTNEFLQRVLKQVKIECPPPLTNARMIDRLVGEYIECVFNLKREFFMLLCYSQ